MSLLAAEFLRRGHEVALVTLSPPSDDFFRLPPGVERFSIGLEGESAGPLRGVMMNLRRIVALRRCFARYRPAVVLTFLTSMNVLCCVASLGSRHRLVVSERVDPAQYSVGRAWDALRGLAYRRAALLAVQTETIACWFRSASVSPPVVVIPNPVQIAPGDRKPTEPPYVLGVGRLEGQKGFDVLIEAFARLAPRWPSLEVRIVGSGSQREALARLAAQRGVADRVRFLGQVEDTTELLRGASVFALPSRFEGFPNALLEALACGVPSVASDCPTGPRELLGDDAHGLLVPTEDAESLAAAIVRLLSDTELASRLSATGSAVAQRYCVEAVADQWEVAMRGPSAT